MNTKYAVAVAEARELSAHRGYTFKEFLYALNVGTKTPQEIRKTAAILAALAASPTRPSSG